MDNATHSAAATTQKAQELMGQGTSMMNSATQKAGEMGISMPASMPTSMPSDMTGKAQSLLDQAYKSMSQLKMSDAESALDKLEAMKGQLSPEWQDRIAKLRSAMEARKSAPALPGGLGTVMFRLANRYRYDAIKEGVRRSTRAHAFLISLAARSRRQRRAMSRPFVRTGAPDSRYHPPLMSHDHGQKDFGKAFAIGVSLNTLFIVVEIVFGIAAGSLALLTDAGHNASDVVGLLLSWVAVYLGKRRPTERRTYGLKRSSILAALANAILLLVAVGGIAWEAIGRFRTPVGVASTTIMVVAGVGIVVNGITTLLFMSGRKGDINIEGAFLHMAADTGVSLGVLIAGAVIALTGWQWIDPVVSLLIAAVITLGTWGLLKRSVNLAIDAVPHDIDPDAVRRYLDDLPGVTQVHDLHIWGMSTTETALTVHLVRPEPDQNDTFLTRICSELHDRFGIEHATVQIERGLGPPCALASPDVV